ncbi:hypothetical protein ISF79_01630 [Burkholderia pseudomallei]|nr:hypothetical protein [Burkholderia pseudomallei]
MERQFLELLRDRGFDDDQLKEAGFGFDDNTRRAFAIKRVLEAPEAFGQSFSKKDWLLFGTSKHDPFIIGDHPRGLQNTRPNDGSYGNIGLAAEGGRSISV